MKKRILLASTVALSFAPVLATQAEEVLWTARSVEQIQNDLTKTDNKTSYTVQYGDTLSTIAEALGVDVTVLANLNKITNMDLIFPDNPSILDDPWIDTASSHFSYIAVVDF